MIETVIPESSHHQRVIELGNANSRTLGFLPYEAIKHAAAEGRVLGFVEDDVVKGYVLFGKRVRTGDISLTHLCVDGSQRGRGIARTLVEGIVERYPQSAGIRLSCREDYEANTMWPELGFESLGKKPGRSKAGHLLEVWWREISAPNLFGILEQEPRTLVAVDTNILLDILEERDFPASRALTADWVSESTELAITEQSCSVASRRPRREHFATDLDEFKILKPSAKTWKAWLQSLQGDPSVASVNETDLRVVAQAAAASATWLISRDEGLCTRAEAIQKLTGLRLVGPDDYLLQLHSHGGEHIQSRIIAASGLSLATADEMPSNADLASFCHQHAQEGPSALRQRLSIVAGVSSGRIEQLVSDSGEALALGAIHREADRITITALRGVQGPYLYAAIRQMAHHLRAAAAKAGAAAIVVDDRTRPEVDQALHDEGFRSDGSKWRAVIEPRVFVPNGPLPNELEKFGWARLNAHLVRDYERYAWPSKVFTGTVPSYVVPIHPEYARVILGYEEPQGRLLELNPQVAASRDNVYYRSPRGLESPARLIWWVSGGGALGGVRAISWLDEVETGDPRRLHRKYRNYGVLDEQQVVDAATSSGSSPPKATAMLFSQTEVFSAPVPITRSRELWEDMNQPGFFRTTRSIEEEAVRRFYEEGRSYGG